MQHFGPFELLVIQPTPFCNIDCRYCYLPDRTRKGLIDHSTVNAIFTKAFASRHCARSICVVWHAGEPLVAPRDLYSYAFARCESLRPPDVNVTQYIQTNGTLIDPDWCTLFKEANVRIGISLDGPKELHDLNRRTRSSCGTFDMVMKGVELLQRNDIEFSALAVVTSETLTDARAFHDFFVSRGIMSIALNIEEIEHQHTTSTLTAPTSVRRFHGFITELYELSQASGLRVREFERARNSIRYFLQTGNGPCISPFYPLSIDYLGNFTVFAPELLGVKHARYGSFALGNVNDDDLDDALDSAAFHAINRDIALGMDMCRANCGYFGVCGGGSPSNKLFENGRLDSMETLYCLLHIKTLVPVVSRGLVVGAQTGGQ